MPVLECNQPFMMLSFSLSSLSFLNFRFLSFYSWRCQERNILRTKGISLRNCSAASVGEYYRVIKYYQLSWKRKLATVKRFKAKQLFRVANLRYQLCSVDNTKLLL